MDRTSRNNNKDSNNTQVCLIIKTSWSHSKTHHTRNDYSERAISPKQRPLPNNTTFKKR